MRTIRTLVLVAAAAGCAKSTSTKNADGGSQSAASQPISTPAPTDIPAPPDVAAPPADAEKTASGLASKVLAKGTGTEHPEAQDTVKVHYTGWTTDGKMFDSSVKRGQPATFPLGGVIKGWTEGLQLMVVAEKRRFWIPAELAYGNKPGRPQGMLVFDVELLDIKKGPKPIPAPSDVAAPPADATKTASGISTKLIKAANGPKAKPDSIVKVDFTAWATDGKMLDSTVARGAPQTLPLEHAPPGLKEAVALMNKGETRRFWIPKSAVMRGGGGPEGDMVVFEITLLDIIEVAPPPDVKAPPKDAQKTASGIASKVLQKGTGTDHPTKDSVVSVNYTGWTTDGKMFDSSITRGKPAEFSLSGVIPGWTEGVQLMVPGEKRRFWIPEELAYKGKGGPQGTLVFDIELLKIVK
jgi:FKBP-type peptidyl-prolyl cis-trans isomerase